jgi:Flp pilus assembly protein TadB
MIERQLEVVVVTRGLNLIRSYFIEKEPLLEKYLVFASRTSNDPSFASVGYISGRRALLIGLPQIVALFNSFMCAVFSSVIIRFLSSEPTLWAIAVGITCFAVVWRMQYSYYRKRTDQMEQKFRDTKSDVR